MTEQRRWLDTKLYKRYKKMIKQDDFIYDIDILLFVASYEAIGRSIEKRKAQKDKLL